MSWSSERSVAAGFGLGLAILVAMVVNVYHDIGRLNEATGRIAHAHDVLTELDRLLAAVTDAETGIRGYVLTGDEHHLASYHVATTSLDERLRRLGESVATNPTQRELLELLASRVRDTLDVLRETIDSRARLGADGAWKVVLTGKGKQRTDALRRTIVTMQTAEQDLLRRRTADQTAGVQQVIVTVLAGGTFAFVLVALAGILVRRDIGRRKRADEALQRATVKLTGWADALDQRGREVPLLGEMGDLLQGCRAPQEAYTIVWRFAPQLFPGANGILAIMTPEKDRVESVATWGTAVERDQTFAPNACWALRRRALHTVEDPDHGTVCAHVGRRLAAGYVCIPLLAHGELLGVLHVEDPADGAGGVPKHVREAKRQLAVSVAQHVALALSNLRLREALRQQAIRDPLTDLFNRRYMEESLEREISRASRRGTPLGIIMLDIDHFKRFNDTYGHDAGDSLLRAVAGFIKTHIRGEDIPCRYGGEEFTLILPGAPLDSSAQRAEQLRRGIEALRAEHEGQPLGSVTLSFGVAVFPEHGPTGDAVIRAADVALYRAKQEGRNRVVVAG